MINSLRIRVEITYASAQIAINALENWQQLLESLILPGGMSWHERRLLRQMKILPHDGEMLKPRLVGTKLTLDIKQPSIFHKGKWETVCEIMGDLVPDVAASRGLSGKCYPVPASLSAIEVKLEMRAELLKFGKADPLLVFYAMKRLR